MQPNLLADLIPSSSSSSSGLEEQEGGREQREVVRRNPDLLPQVNKAGTEYVGFSKSIESTTPLS